MARGRTPRVRYKYREFATGRRLPDVSNFSPCVHASYEGLLVSEGHSRLKSGAWSGGGPLYIYKRQRTSDGGWTLDYVRNNINYQYRLQGVSGIGAWSVPTPASFPSLSEPLVRDFSASGYARTRPGNPEASFSNALIELALEGLPAMIGNSLYKGLRDVVQGLKNRVRVLAERASSEYLNAVFGWLPIVDELRNLYKLGKAIDKRLSQLRAENGRVIQRQATLHSDTNVTIDEAKYETGFVNVHGAPPDHFSAGQPKCTVTTTVVTQEKVWYAARYRYWVPEIESFWWDVRARAALFGATPTISVIWEALPWSWMVDWFGTVGDVVSNMSPNAVDNLVQLDAWIMHHRTIATTAHSHTSIGPIANTVPGFKVQVSGGVDRHFFSKDKIETKVRVGAGSPYGPGLSWSAFTGRQVAILAALGITRGKILR